MTFTSCKALAVSVLVAQVAMSPALSTELLGQDGIRFELGGGAKVAPVYEGSSDYMFSPRVLVRVKSFRMGSFGFGGGDKRGFSVGPSIKYIGDREVSDDAILTGITEIDASLEAGLKFSYEWDYANVFAQVRYGFVGHVSFVGEVGANAIMRPTSDITINIGPRLSFADRDYMNTYFSVPTTAAFLPPYSASGGIKSAGIEASIRYDFNEYWALEGSAEWNRLLGDAADSPIVAAGSDDQFIAKFGIVRKFHINF